jgi:hypothetical protein
MIVALALFALTATSTSPSDACAGVVDSTPACASPSKTASKIASDTKPDALPPGKASTSDTSIDPTKLPSELGFIATALAVGGGFILLASIANEPSSIDQLHAQQYEQLGGASLLVASGLVGASLAALSLFDPSTGSFRLKKLYEGAD